MKDPAGFGDVGGCVSEGEMVLCDDYGVGVLGARRFRTAFHFCHFCCVTPRMLMVSQLKGLVCWETCVFLFI